MNDAYVEVIRMQVVVTNLKYLQYGRGVQMLHSLHSYKYYTNIRIVRIGVLFDVRDFSQLDATVKCAHQPHTPKIKPYRSKFTYVCKPLPNHLFRN